MCSIGTSNAVVVLVGDSDIERWPPALAPHGTVKIRGQSGAALEQVLPLMKAVLEEYQQQQQPLTIVFCAGENDIGQSIRLDETLVSFRKLLEMVFPTTAPSATTTTTNRHLIVLGPKFEPWLEYDNACRKQYFKLSNAMERACKKHTVKDENKLVFVDCLTMFCGESAHQPGAVLGGKAIPEKKYFDYDLLHLSKEGYQVWKNVTEQYIL